MLPPSEFFSLEEDFQHRELFAGDAPVWTVLERLRGYLAAFFEAPGPLSGITGLVERPIVILEGEARQDLEVRTGGPDKPVEVLREGRPVEDAAVILPGAYLFNDQVLLGPGTIVEPGAFLRGPVVIGAGTEVRQGAYVRGDCLIGSGCVVGHTTEIKASVMLDGAKAGHFAYIGDSILGRDVNLGAGTKLANLKIIPGTVSVRSGRERFDTGRRKVGAILGDRTETGCNSVTSPGTLMGPQSIVYPAVAVPSGHYPARTVVMPAQGSLRIRSPKEP